MAWPNPVPERCFQFWTIILIVQSQKKTKQSKKKQSEEPGLAKSCAREVPTNITTPSYEFPQIEQTYRESLDLSGGIPSSESYSFVGLLKRLKHRFKTPSHFRGKLTSSQIAGAS